MKVYFLSGLGADKTFFQSLDLSFCEPFFIDWINPLKKESLSSYAARIKKSFMEDDATVVGLSFGGMLATEIAKQNPNTYSILISSAKTRFEIPSWYRAGKYIPLQHLAPESFQRWFMLRMKYRLGIRNDFEKKIFTELIKRNNKEFNAWAVDALLNWDNDFVPENIIHIHGTHDKVLPYKNVKADVSLRGGEHMMILSMADVISPLIKKLALERVMNTITVVSS